MRAFRIFLCALLLAGLAGAFSEAAAQRFVWVKPVLKSPDGTNINCRMVADAHGNTYLFGTFTYSVELSPTVVFYSSGTGINYDVFLAKYDPAGGLLWAQQGRSDWTDQDNGLAVDESGNVFVSGFNWTTFTFGGLTIGPEGYFLARFDAATGAVGWLRHVEDFRLDGSHFNVVNLTPDGRGGCSVTGNCMFRAALDSIPLVNTGNTDAYVAHFNAAGNFEWVTQIFNQTPIASAAIEQPVSRLTIDPAGNHIIVGSFRDSISFDRQTWLHGTVDSMAGQPGGLYHGPDIFMAKYGPTGNLLWARQASGSWNHWASSVVTDYLGNIYVAGGSDAGLTDFGNGIATTFRGATFLVKYNAAGTPLWVRQFLGPGSAFPTDLIIDGKASLTMIGSYWGAPLLDTVNLPLTPVGPRYRQAQIFVANFNADGRLQWTTTTGGVASDHGAQIQRDNQGDLYLLTSSDTATVIGGVSIPARGYQITLSKLASRSARVTGTAYLDRDGDGARGAAEPVFPRPVFVRETRQPLPQQALADTATGRYQLAIDTGAYHVSIPHTPRYHTLTQGAAGYTGHLRTYGQTDTARTFGFAPIANRTDVRVTLTAFSNARQGFANRYRARIENLGTTATAGVLTVQFDGLMRYSGAATPPTSHTTTSATWAYANLAPFEVRNFDLAATTPITAPLDTLLHSRATVTTSVTDLDPTNNLDVIAQRVTGSYDPNDLTVNYTTLTPAQVASGTLLDYVVRFQNMGNDTAFTVVITDTLAGHLLQLGTLELVGASHNCWYDVLANNQLVMHFDNIKLPASSVSVLNSMGFVRFQVKPSAALTPGALIPNTAHIVFDYNAPLATNEVSTLVQTPNGLVAAPATTAGSLYPNPATATDFVTLTADIPTTGSATVRVLDALGRPVREQVLTVPAGALHYPLDVRGLASGLYVVRLTAANGISTSQRLVIGERR